MTPASENSLKWGGITSITTEWGSMNIAFVEPELCAVKRISAW